MLGKADDDARALAFQDKVLGSAREWLLFL